MTVDVDARVRNEIGAFLRDNYLYLHPGVDLGDDDDLLELRIMDSMGFVELVEEVQQRFGVVVADDEITAANFGSINAVAAFVSRGRPA